MRLVQLSLQRPANRTTSPLGRIAIGIFTAFGWAAFGSPLDSPMKFSVHYIGAGGVWALAEGQITQSTPDDFERFIRFMENADDRSVSLSFNSPGGSLSAALRLGRLIRKYGLDTIVAGPYSENDHFKQRVL